MAAGGALRTRLLKRGEAFTLEPRRGGFGGLVPAGTCFIAFEAGAGVDDQQRLDPFGVCTVKGKRHVAAQRQPADDRRLRPHRIEDRRHIRHRVRLAVGVLIFRVIALAMAAHIPQHQRVAAGKWRDLPLPHFRCGGIAVGEEQNGAGSMGLVMDIHPSAVELWHGDPPVSVCGSLQKL